MDISEITGIIDIFLTLIIGFWLTRYLDNRDSSSRVLKDYYIEEAKQLQDDVRKFFSRLLSNHVPGAELTRWHKSHKNRFKSFDESIRKSFPVECPLVNNELFKIHREITNLEEFNSGFSTGEFNFPPNVRTRIDALECSALTLLNDYVVQINKSTGLGVTDRILQELGHEFVYYVKKMKSYGKYFLLWFKRGVFLAAFLTLSYSIFSLCKDYYSIYLHEKKTEQERMQMNINKALEIIDLQNAKLDSIDYDLRNIKDNMRFKNVVNNF